MTDERPAGRWAKVLRGVNPRALVVGVLFLALVTLWIVVLVLLSPNAPGRELSYDQLLSEINAGHIQGDITLLSYDAEVTGTLKNGTRFWTAVSGGTGAPSDTAFAPVVLTLFEKSVHFRLDPQTDKRLLGVATQFALPSATMITGFAFIYLLFRGPGGLGTMYRSRARRYVSNFEKGVTFADVAGMDEAIDELREVKDVLADPDRLTALGARAPRGVLLIGPPGCGKTLLARAVAGEAKVPFFSLSGSEFTEQFVGVGAARVRDLFKQAREAAPAIVFVDELDAIGRARSGGDSSNAEWESTLNELLVQLDGFDAASRVVLMAATNRPDILDVALLRKGRFDRQVVIDVPDRAGRMAIFRAHCRGKPVSGAVDWEAILHRTLGFTGADIAATMNEAALLASRRGMHQIGQAEVSSAVDRVVAGPERRSRIMDTVEKERTAYHEAGHAVMGWLLPQTIHVDKVSLVARGHSQGSTWNRPTDERRLVTDRQLQDYIAVALSGRAAERVVFGDASSSAQTDLQRATALARQMVRDYGMSEALGPYVFGPRDAAHGGDYSYDLAAKADAEVLRVLEAADARAAAALGAHRDQLDRVARELIQRETLERADLVALLGTAGADPTVAIARPTTDDVRVGGALP